MSRNQYWTLGGVVAGLVALGAFAGAARIGNADASTGASSGDYPAPIAALRERGIDIIERFDAPGDLVGYAAKAGPRPIAVYLTPDRKHVIVGTMLDAQGREVTSEALKPLIQSNREKDYQDAWPRLQQSHWVADGSPDAERVLYVFTDPNCPYCHKLWKRTRSAVADGKVQLRHILVGILKPSSPGKAAAILGADKPAAALTRNEQTFGSGGVMPARNPGKEVKQQLAANRRLMRDLGIRGTPAVLYKNASGEMRTARGLPSERKLNAMLAVD